MDDEGVNLTKAGDVLWAKLSQDREQWLPLKVHMRDTMGVSYRLWDTWLSDSVKSMLQSGISPSSSEKSVRDLLAFVSAAHDIGKASPEFQAKINNDGCPIRQRVFDAGLGWGILQGQGVLHALVSMLILERNGLDRSVSMIVGSHHGKPPSLSMISKRTLAGYASHTGFSSRAWVSVQDVLYKDAVRISGIDEGWLRSVRISVPCQDLLIGIVIMADWIASNTECFDLIPVEQMHVTDPDARASSGWGRMRFPHHSGLVYGREMSFKEAFSFDPRPFQAVALDAVRKMDVPGIVVVEAPTGEGKTEAALAMAEVLSGHFGQNGLFFGLPTQATANGVFTRIHAWVEHCSGTGTKSLYLAHGKSCFNDEYSKIPRDGWDSVAGNPNSVVVHEWFGGKKGLLSDVVVGTVDQVLMAGLKRKHLFLRHLGLAEKVVIIDECHAYDEYMGSYLRKALRWLGSFQVPVILMSATLPPKNKERLVSAYLGRDVGQLGGAGYPQITCAMPTRIDVVGSARSGRDVDPKFFHLSKTARL